ncbi:hypothetical protein [Actinomadura rifamycini]|uniref:hypothetical protein n=1 Tax=Actinomadura rifamycini TaxID=31962 RepID=UPI0004229DB9|nr:hypothetical protein [Actinomadura rifamycini]
MDAAVGERVPDARKDAKLGPEFARMRRAGLPTYGLMDKVRGAPSVPTPDGPPSAGLYATGNCSAAVTGETYPGRAPRSAPR